MLWGLLVDFARRPAQLHRVHRAIRHHSARIRKRPGPTRTAGPGLPPVYVRGDLWFGVESGGSVGHIAGVLHHFGDFYPRPILLTTDRIPTVREDRAEVHLVLPRREFWDFPELPALALNETFVKDALRLLANRPVAFVYQRHCLHGLMGAWLSGTLEVPLVLEYNGSEAWIQRYWGRRLRYEQLGNRIELLSLQAAGLVVVVSQALREELVTRGVAADKILVNPNGVDPQRYSPTEDGSAVRARYDLDGRTVIGFIGTFGPWHGAEVLAEAFGRLLQEQPSYRKLVRLVMIGDGIRMPQVRAAMTRHGAGECTALTGMVPQEDGPAHLAACDILVAPTVPNPDGTPFFGSPTKVFEYMAMGKGIVASDLDQVGEVLSHGRTAWLTRPGDPVSLAEGIRALIDDPDLRRRLGEAARQEVLDKYTWKAHTQRIIEKLKERCG